MKHLLLMILLSTVVFGQVSENSTVNLPVYDSSNLVLSTTDGQYNVIGTDFQNHITRDFWIGLEEIETIRGSFFTDRFSNKGSGWFVSEDNAGRVLIGDKILIQDPNNRRSGLWVTVTDKTPEIAGGAYAIHTDYAGPMTDRGVPTDPAYVRNRSKMYVYVPPGAPGEIPTQISHVTTPLESKIALRWDERLRVTSIRIESAGESVIVPVRGNTYDLYYGGWNPSSGIAYDAHFRIHLINTSGEEIQNQLYRAPQRQAGGTRIIRYSLTDGVDDWDTQIKLQYVIGNGPETFNHADNIHLFMGIDASRSRVSMGENWNIRNGEIFRASYNISRARHAQGAERFHRDREPMFLYLDDDSASGSQVSVLELFAAPSVRYTAGMYFEYDSATRGPRSGLANHVDYREDDQYEGWTFSDDGRSFRWDFQTSNDHTFVISHQGEGISNRVVEPAVRDKDPDGFGLDHSWRTRVNVRVFMRVNGEVSGSIKVLELERANTVNTHNWRRTFSIENTIQPSYEGRCSNCGPLN